MPFNLPSLNKSYDAWKWSPLTREKTAITFYKLTYFDFDYSPSIFITIISMSPCHHSWHRYDNDIFSLLLWYDGSNHYQTNLHTSPSIYLFYKLEKKIQKQLPRVCWGETKTTKNARKAIRMSGWPSNNNNNNTMLDFYANLIWI